MIDLFFNLLCGHALISFNYAHQTILQHKYWIVGLQKYGTYWVAYVNNCEFQ